jgi:hypothetical protein
MSFEPITYWKFRCDGDTTRGQCTEVYSYFPDEEDELEVAINDKPELGMWKETLERDGWTATGRLLCPRHVASVERMLLANLEGLPFYELSGEQS